MRFSGRGQNLVYTLFVAWLFYSAYRYFFNFVYGDVAAVIATQQAPPRTVETIKKDFDTRLENLEGRHDCQEATGEWAFVCTRSYTSAEGAPIKQRIAVPRQPNRPEVVIPDSGPIPTMAEVKAYSTAADRYSRRLDINSASEESLVRLPRIAHPLAKRIVAAAANKPFTTVDELLQIEGMTERKLSGIRHRIRVGSEGRPTLEQFIAARSDAPADLNGKWSMVNGKQSER